MQVRITAVVLGSFLMHVFFAGTEHEVTMDLRDALNTLPSLPSLPRLAPNRASTASRSVSLASLAAQGSSSVLAHTQTAAMRRQHLRSQPPHMTTGAAGIAAGRSNGVLPPSIHQYNNAVLQEEVDVDVGTTV